MREIKELTGLRFIAALYVFLFHLQLRGVLPDLGWRLNNIASQGALGVNIFFVLSGLVLTYSHLNSQRNEIPFRAFMLKRFIRIAPVYIVGLCATVIASVVLHNIPPGLPALFLINLTFLNAWIPSISMEWYGSGSWSVSTEIFFYCLFPLLLPFMLRLGQRKIAVLLVVLLVVAALPGLFHATHSQLNLFRWVYCFPPARLPEFIVGILTAILVFRYQWRVPAWIALIGIFIMLGYLAYCGPMLDGYVGHNWIVLPVLAVFAASISHGKANIFGWMASRLFVYLGQVSYGFYIWQIVLMVALDTLQERYQIPLHSFRISLTLLAINLLLSMLSYHLLESVLHRQLSTTLLARSRA